MDVQDLIARVKVEGYLDYGDVAALHHQAQEIGLVQIVDQHVPKAQGISVGVLVGLMAINRCVDPNSFSA